MSSAITTTDEETATKGDYGRIPLSEQEDWVDEPSQEEEEEEEASDDTQVLPTGQEEGEAVQGGDDDGDDTITTDTTTTTRRRRRRQPSSDRNSLWNARILPDDRFSIGGVALVDGAPAVKLLKFVAVTLAAIGVMHRFVRVMVRTYVAFAFL